jgi:hypothetical protein
MWIENCYSIACAEPVHTKKCSANVGKTFCFSLKRIGGREDYHDFCVSTFFGENVSFSHHSAGFKQKTTTLKGGERTKKKIGPRHIIHLLREFRNSTIPCKRAAEERERNEALLADHRLVSCSSRSR